MACQLGERLSARARYDSRAMYDSRATILLTPPPPHPPSLSSSLWFVFTQTLVIVAVHAPHVNRAIVDVDLDLKSKDKAVSRHGSSGPADRALGL